MSTDGHEVDVDREFPPVFDAVFALACRNVDVRQTSVDRRDLEDREALLGFVREVETDRCLLGFPLARWMEVRGEHEV